MKMLLLRSFFREKEIKREEGGRRKADGSEIDKKGRV